MDYPAIHCDPRKRMAVLFDRRYCNFQPVLFGLFLQESHQAHQFHRQWHGLAPGSGFQ
jgi:hypothetical protein